MKEELFVSSTLYEEMQIQKLGWINCDRFLNATSTTDLIVNTNKKDSILFASIFLVFQDLNSLIQDNYYSGETNIIHNNPVGSKVTLLAVSIKRGKIYSSKQNFTVNKDFISLTFVPREENEVRNLFKF